MSGVSVLVAGKGIFGIVQVQGFQLVQSDDPVEFPENPVQILHDIIACVVDVAGIETHAHIGASHGIDDRFQFFKTSAHLAALACHGFQQHRHRVIMAQRVFQSKAMFIIFSLRHIYVRMALNKMSIIKWQIMFGLLNLGIWR